VKSHILDLSEHLYDGDPAALPLAAEGQDDVLSAADIRKLVAEFTEAMHRAADEMDFEKAAELRDRILLLKDMELGLKPPSRALLNAPLKPADEKKPGTPGPRGKRGAPSRGKGGGGGPPHGKTGIGPRRSR
jgi:excinuclease ABC subunit B